MDIAPYIADLLSQHDEVNVPSLGTFRKQQKGAFYDPLKQEFFPPSHGLILKETQDNAVLASYIREQKNVSTNTANYFIEKFVTQLKADLSAKGQAEIESIGTLKRSKDGTIFIDALNFDSQGNFFGLQPVKELNAAHAETVDEAVLPPVDHPKTQGDSPALTADMQAEELEVSGGKKISSASKIILIAAFLILAGIITYLVNPALFEGFRQQTNIPKHKVPSKQPVHAPVKKTLADSLAEADTIYKELTKQGFEVEKPRDTLVVSTEAQVVSPEPREVSFEIIGAAFARRAEAEAYVKQLQAKGIYARIVENMPGSKLKISLGTFNDEASARQGLIRIKKELNKDAWIARVKPKKTN
jgi:nucleoid DNA-binding protein